MAKASRRHKRGQPALDADKLHADSLSRRELMAAYLARTHDEFVASLALAEEQNLLGTGALVGPVMCRPS
jgi:hypothetical protein